MNALNALQCGWVAVHVFGLVAASLVRISAGSRAEGSAQGGFLLGLAGVALATMAGEMMGWPVWTLSAATMALMIVVAIADFRAIQPDCRDVIFFGYDYRLCHGYPPTI